MARLSDGRRIQDLLNMQSEPKKPPIVVGLNPVQAADYLRSKRLLPTDRLLIAKRPYSAPIAKAANAAGRLGPTSAPPIPAARTVVYAATPWGRLRRRFARAASVVGCFVARLFRRG